MKALIPFMLISLISCQEGKVETVAKKSVNTSEPYTFITDAEDPKPPVADPLYGYPDALSYNNQVSMNETYLDYLIMDVCVDSNNRIIKGDPATCQKRRNIRIGERLPYLLTDFDRANSARYQALSSLPMVGTDGKLKVMVTKHFQGNLTPSFKFNYTYDKNVSGYDLIDPNGIRTSIIRTSDGGCFDQVMRQSKTVRSGGWVLFDVSMTAGSLNHTILLDRIDPDRPSKCTQGVDTDANTRAIWNAPTNFTFESSKTLKTLITYHYAHKDLTKKYNALERFFFTREYGFTRWEAWMPMTNCLRDFEDKTKCDPNHASHFLRGRCNPKDGLTTWGEQPWVRVDCRDSSFQQDLDTSTIPIDPQMATTNGIIDVDPDYNFVLGPEIFNVTFYMKKYPDVGTSVSSATTHWLTRGIAEGRQGSETFAVQTYLERYPDVRREYGSDYKKSIIHYSRYGIPEGRKTK